MSMTRYLKKLSGFNRQAVAVAVADPQQEDCPLVLVNPAFEQLTGYAGSDALGRNCRFLQCDETDPKGVAKLRGAVEARESGAVLLLNRRRDGALFHNFVCLDPVTAPDGGTLLIGCLFGLEGRALQDDLRRFEGTDGGEGDSLHESVRRSITARRRMVLTLAQVFLDERSRVADQDDARIIACATRRSAASTFA